MTTQLYDLYVAPRDDEKAMTFLMRAPIGTLRVFLSLHDDAVRRIDRETSVDRMPCFLYSNRRDANKVHIVLKAATPLAASI